MGYVIGVEPILLPWGMDGIPRDRMNHYVPGKTRHYLILTERYLILWMLLVIDFHHQLCPRLPSISPDELRHNSHQGAAGFLGLIIEYYPILRAYGTGHTHLIYLSAKIVC